MKALTRAALVAVALGVLVLASTNAAFAARPADGDMPGNGYGHCRNFPNNGHQGEAANGRAHQRDGGTCENAPWNEDGTPGGDTRAEGGGNGDGTPADPHDGDMPGNGYGHCRNFPNNGHQGEAANGRGHQRDGGTCDDAPWNRGGDTGGEDDLGDADDTGDDTGDDLGGEDAGDGDDTGGDTGRGEDDTRRDGATGGSDDDTRAGAAGESDRAPVDAGDRTADEDGSFPIDAVRAGDEAVAGEFTAPESAAAQGTGDDTGALGGAAAAGAADAALAAVPTRIDAGFGLTGVTAQSGLAAVAMAAALAGAFGSLVRRSSWSAR